MNKFLFHLPALVIIIPLAGGVLSPVINRIKPGVSKWFVTVLGALEIGCVLFLLKRVLHEGQIYYCVGGWAPPYGIELAIDGLNILILLLVSIIGFLAMVFSNRFTSDDEMKPVRTMGFYALMSTLVAGLSGMTITGDVFNMYVFLEVASLSGYTLIATGGYRGNVAALRYMMLGTIGTSFYLLGIGILYGCMGTLNMRDLSILSKGMFDNPQMIIPVAFIVIGFGIKMALFPLHGAQPAAHSFAHPAADPMISGIMVKVPAYAMLRFLYSILPTEEYSIQISLKVIGIVSAAGIIYGSVKALQQKDLRRMLAYSSIAQIGYIGLGISVGNTYALIGAVLHIINHAFMKGGLFFALGGVEYKYHTTEIKNLGQLYKKMPITVASMVFMSLSMIGLPPTAGFFSKWYLALGSAQSGQFWLVGILIISCLLTASYFFRIIENIFMDKDKEIKPVRADAPFELHWTMLLPTIVCAVAVLLLGLFNTGLVSILENTIEGVAI